MACNGLKVAVATYNLYWWCVSNKFGNCPQFAFGTGFTQLYQRISSNPVDLIGFQECENVEQVVAGAGPALSNFGYYSTPSGNDAPMAWSWARFKVLEGPASEWIAQDSYSPRWLNWVRLLEYSSNTVIFFANTHGPLGQCTGERGQQVADAYWRSIWNHKKHKDVVIFTGDFNCRIWDQTLVSLREKLEDAAWDTVFQGADHIFAEHGVGLCSQESILGAPSDHQFLKAVLLPHGGPEPPKPPEHDKSQNRSVDATAKDGCPKPPSNGPCCHHCKSNRFCPGDGGCYAEGQSGCTSGTCVPNTATQLLL